MQRSEQIDQLAKSLAAAQGAMENAVKDAANPYFRSKYADLASIWDAVRAPFGANGLSVVQTPAIDGSAVTITTLLMHASGQWIQSDLTMIAQRQLKDGGGWEKLDSPQAIGSTITYARRYALAAMCGVAPEDDDGNAGSGHQGGGNQYDQRTERPQAQRGSQAAADAVRDRKLAEGQANAAPKPQTAAPAAPKPEDIPADMVPGPLKMIFDSLDKPGYVTQCFELLKRKLVESKADDPAAGEAAYKRILAAHGITPGTRPQILQVKKAAIEMWDAAVWNVEAAQPEGAFKATDDDLPKFDNAKPSETLDANQQIIRDEFEKKSFQSQVADMASKRGI